MARLFVSHSGWNNEKAIEVRDWLVKNGWDDVFLDLDPERGIAAGLRWKEALRKAAYRCEVVLALVSKEWLASNWCKAEIDAAHLMGKKVIAALIGIDKNAVPPDLTDQQFIDLTGPGRLPSTQGGIEARRPRSYDVPLRGGPPPLSRICLSRGGGCCGLLRARRADRTLPR
jgi:hypothetical protein